MTVLCLKMSDLTRVIITFLLLCSSVAFAAVDVPGSRDLGTFKRFPLSSIINYEESLSPQYSLALGKIKKANGVAFLEDQSFVAGSLTKITYEIPPGFRTSQVADYVVDQLTGLQAKVLFECKARGCGSSNDWANRQFQQSNLYGLTGEQYYWAAELEGDNFLSIYLTQRGNRKVLLHIEALKSDAIGGDLTKEQMLDRWQKNNRVYVSGSQLSDEQLKVLVEASEQILSERPFSKLWLVGHQVGTNPFLVLLGDSEQEASALRDLLIQAGLPENRIEARGVGPLAPSYDSAPDSRIEILVE